jgi:two-component system sensor histidine kinase TctE
VATEDGLVEIGDAGLPAPAQPLVTGQPQFRNTVFFGTTVRMGSYARLLDRPLAGQPEAQRVVIQVAEALNSREQFSSSLVWGALWRDLALVLVALALLALAIGWALRPLDRLRSEVAARPPHDLTPLDAPDIPADVRPLVAAINAHIARNRRLAEAQRRFVDDASHQLRTPLTTLGTQVAFALRETDPAQLRESLQALKLQVDETVRQTNQMLALARTDSAELSLAPVDLVVLATATCRRWWPEARSRGIDLGLDTALSALTLPAQAGLLDEALANLLHNALRYTPAGGQVTVAVRAEAGLAWLSVADNGPGIPAAEHHRAGERFFRASNANQPGSGLGLAIVRSIAERLGGRLLLAQPDQGSGLVASLVLPLAVGNPPAPPGRPG